MAAVAVELATTATAALDETTFAPIGQFRVMTDFTFLKTGKVYISRRKPPCILMLLESLFCKNLTAFHSSFPGKPFFSQFLFDAVAARKQTIKQS